MADDETFSGTVKAEVQITPPAEPESESAEQPVAEQQPAELPPGHRLAKPQGESEQGQTTVTPDDDPGIAPVEPEMPPIGPVLGPQGIPINPVDGNPIAPGYAKPHLNEDGVVVSPGVAIVEEDDEGTPKLQSAESKSRSENPARSEMPEPERPWLEPDLSDEEVKA